jgi:hypothetical protein
MPGNTKGFEMIQRRTIPVIASGAKQSSLRRDEAGSTAAKLDGFAPLAMTTKGLLSVQW